MGAEGGREERSSREGEWVSVSVGGGDVVGTGRKDVTSVICKV